LIVDFCCPQLHLVVEVDGQAHAGQAERDTARQRLLEDRGYRVVRLTAAEVEANTQDAVARIKDIVRQHAAQPPLSQNGRGGRG
jgi:very-short-patch-repair endonuclease